MALEIPSLYNNFDLETELEVQKQRIPIVSGGLWTDTSNTDPGIVNLRLGLEEIQRLLYSLSARTVSDDIILHLARLLGIESEGPQYSQGVLGFNVAPGTTIQAGFQVADEVKGEVYQTKVGHTSAAGGLVTLEAIALVAGPNADTLEPGSITGIRSAPTAGQIYSVTNTTPFSGGKNAETVAEFKKRLPKLIQNDTILRPRQFRDAGESNTSVARAKIYRGLRPGALAGQFEREADHCTLVLLANNGVAPAPSVLTAVRDAILANTIFTLSDDNLDESGLHVLGARSRAVGSTGNLVALPGIEATVLKAAAEGAVAAYMHPLTGGQNGEGFEMGRPPRLYEVGQVLEGVTGLDYVKDGTLTITGAANMAIDEVVSAGVINYTVVYS